MKAIRLLFSVALSFAVAPAFANVAIGQPAPEFSATDSQGRTQTLSQYKGKTVVLEWSNPGCPFVQKHYSSGNIPKQQADAVKEGVIWLTINSGAAGKQGHLDAKGAQDFIAQNHAAPSAYLFDGDGKIGHAYGAKTTPHLYVIDGSGTLRYMGGIDSIPSADKEDLPKATQYVPQVLAELKAGKPVSVATSEPYGCGVKYGS